MTLQHFEESLDCRLKRLEAVVLDDNEEARYRAPHLEGDVTEATKKQAELILRQL